MNNLIQHMETIRTDYIRLAEIARNDEHHTERECFIEIIDLMTDLIHRAEEVKK
jgi:hypothetical protein